MSVLSSARKIDAAQEYSFPQYFKEPEASAAAIVEAEAAQLRQAAKADLDAAARIALLNETFLKGPASFDVKPEGKPDKVPASRAHALKAYWQQHSRVLKTLIGLLVVLAAGWVPMRSLLQTTSTEAVINARLVTLRAPIDGQVQSVGNPSAGTPLAPGAVLVNIGNTRAERGRLDDLRRLVGELEIETKSLLVKRNQLEALRTELSAQTRAFQDGRVNRLEARVAELRSELQAAAARREEANHALERARALAQSGTTSAAVLEKARRDATIAIEAEAALGHRLVGEEVELAALRNGVYVGDSYNDRPQSQQLADEITMRLSDVVADLNQREARLAALRSEFKSEEMRYNARASASLTAPVNGSIWEVMTAPGETVVQGQELVRVLDCTGLVVTATVGETAYNDLRVGDPASFRFRGESVDHAGRIISLTGFANAPANLAIQPSALAKEPYRVTVALPELARAGECRVGQTGRVTFNK